MGNVGFSKWSFPLMRFATEGAAGSLTAGAPDVTRDLSGPWGARVNELDDCLGWYGRPARIRTGKMPVPPNMECATCLCAGR